MFRYTLMTGSDPAVNVAKVRSSSVIPCFPFAPRSPCGWHAIARCAVVRVGGKTAVRCSCHFPRLLGHSSPRSVGKRCLTSAISPSETCCVSTFKTARATCSAFTRGSFLKCSRIGVRKALCAAPSAVSPWGSAFVVQAADQHRQLRHQLGRLFHRETIAQGVQGRPQPHIGFVASSIPTPA